MKLAVPFVCLVVPSLMSGASSVFAQSAAPPSPQTLPPPTPYQITSQDPNSRVWQSTSYELAPDGTSHPRLHQYTELASGLNYQSNGQWVASQELIEPYAGGAIAQQGSYQIIFSDNINSAGSIDEQTFEGKRLRSSILGLAYFDQATSNTVVFAQIQDSEGQLISANQVLYTNSFAGVDADVRYTYERSRFEQEVILRQQLPTPESYGLNSASTELEVLTEFVTPPPANVAQLKSIEQISAGLEPDHLISWGATALSRGHAFDLGDNVQVPVSKQYENINGRQILIEKVRLQTILPYLANLPEFASLDRPHPLIASRTPSLPKPRATRRAGKPLKFARLAPAKGFVLDYISITSGYTNFTFQGDSTYYVSGLYEMNFTGTTYFEGGTVIKFASGAAITAEGLANIVFESSAFLPVTFTAKDDNTGGQTISGSTGSPVGYYASSALNLYDLDTTPTLSDFKVAYASIAVGSGGSPFNLYDFQFCNCAEGVYLNGGTSTIENGLMNGVLTNVTFGGGSSLIAEHVTFNNAFAMAPGRGLGPGTSIALTNCVLANVTNVFGTGACNGWYRSKPVGIAIFTNTFNPFQTVLGGGLYLTNGCAFRNAGTNRIDPVLLAELPDKTTWAPLVYSNVAFSTPTNFSPCVPRDTNASPDLGYHYSPLDYVFGGVNAYSNITFTAGTAVGWYNGGPWAATNDGYGIALNGSAQATLTGTATAPCILAKVSLVQEGETGYWTDEGNLGGFTGFGLISTPATAPTVNFHFTHCYSRNYDGPFCRDYGDGTLLVVNANSSEFYGGAADGYAMDFAFTNCLGVRATLGADCSCSSAVTMRNCTFYGGQLVAERLSSATWPLVVEDCAFCGTVFTNLNDTSGGNTNITWVNYNSYLTTDTQPSGQGSHYVTVTNYNWQSSWFGDYYLPPTSPLLAEGSTTANLIGLYHFTTQTNQAPETNAIVDLGYHYVATAGNGVPLDTNGDGVPDYLEDANGDGLFDAGDLDDWQISPYGLAGANSIQVFTPLK